MATIQLGRTQSANRLISYAEKRAEVREGVDCPSEYAKSQMNATRQIWGKTDGVQAHHVIQSFKPGEVTPEMANEIGRDLAKEIAKGHECVVYTHTDKEHIHNHIVINSVNYENGSKYQAHGKEAIEQVRETSDRLCMERDLSVVKEKSAEVRYTQAEKSLVEQGKHSWKDEIRDKIDQEKKVSKSYEELKENLLEKHGIEVRERGKNTTYINHENGKRVRGNKLGEAYEKETIKHEYQKYSREQERGSARAEGVAEANERLERPHEGLHQNEHGQGNSREADLRDGNRQHQDHQQAGDRPNAFDFDEARKALKRSSSNVAKGYDRSTRRDEAEQQSDPSKDGANRGQSQQGNDRNKEPHANRNQQHEQELTKQNERVRSQQQEIGPER